MELLVKRAAVRSPAAPGAATAPRAVCAAARDIIERVRSEGDAALLALTEQFDGVRLEALAVTAQEFAAAERAVTAEQHAAIERAIDNVRRFHAAQSSPPLRVETSPGVICERFSVPIRAVGLYVPSGSAPLPSTAIMLAVPAALAACPVKRAVHRAQPHGQRESSGTGCRAQGRRRADIQSRRRPSHRRHGLRQASPSQSATRFLDLAMPT